MTNSFSYKKDEATVAQWFGIDFNKVQILQLQILSSCVLYITIFFDWDEMNSK